jgi:hypothetical protein
MRFGFLDQKNSARRVRNLQEKWHRSPDWSSRTERSCGCTKPPRKKEKAGCSTLKRVTFFLDKNE